MIPFQINQLAKMSVFFFIASRRHEALSSFGQSLAPVDVWTAGNCQRRLQQKINMDFRDITAEDEEEEEEEAIVVDEDNGPEFTE